MEMENSGKELIEFQSLSKSSSYKIGNPLSAKKTEPLEV